MAKGMGFKAAAASAAKSAGVSPERGAAIVAAGARKASNKAKRANPNLMKVSGVEPPPKMSAKMMGEGTNRAGRIQPVSTDRGNFRFKSNRKGD